MATEARKWAASAPLHQFAPGMFDGKVAVVTGGGTGLGQEIALGLAHLGADVVVAGRTFESLEQTRQMIEDLGRRCLAVPTNIRELEQVQALHAAAYGEFGKVDFLVNNAGGQFPAPPSKITERGWRAVVDLNLNGTWNMTSTFMQSMADDGFGSIVNVVHIHVFDRGAPMFAHSGAARAGVVNLTKSLAPSLFRHGVTVNAFAPGPFVTSGMLASELGSVGRTEDSFLEEVKEVGTMTRLGTVEEMSAIVIFLCSPAARYISGASIVADGAASQSNWVEFFPDEL